MTGTGASQDERCIRPENVCEYNDINEKNCKVVVDFGQLVERYNSLNYYSKVLK
jgi:hypothetical protein